MPIQYFIPNATWLLRVFNNNLGEEWNRVLITLQLNALFELRCWAAHVFYLNKFFLFLRKMKRYKRKIVVCGLIGYLTLTCMTAFSSAIVICLALSTAIATCVWCCWKKWRTNLLKQTRWILNIFENKVGLMKIYSFNQKDH